MFPLALSERPDGGLPAGKPIPAYLIQKVKSDFIKVCMDEKSRD